MRTRAIGAIMVIVVLLVLLWVGGGARAQPTHQGAASVAAATMPLLQYQGRLTDPGTGEPVVDGTYSMSFRLYGVDSDGTALWIETKDVSVQGGVFNALLGDTTALDQSMFNGQALWLGIKVGTDPEATPRQQILPVAYALSLVPGAEISTSSVDPALQVRNAGSGDALHVVGSASVDGGLTVSGGLTGGSHSHSGGDISSGTVAQARIDPAVARDSEIMPTVLGNDGAGSALDADLLDGADSSAFADATHNHSGADIVDGSIKAIDLASGAVTTAKISSSGAGSGQVIVFNGTNVGWAAPPGSLLKTTTLNVTCARLDSFTNVYDRIPYEGPFTKLDADSTLEVTFNGRIAVNSLTGGAGAKFELRVDDTATTNGRARAAFKATEVGNDGILASITGIFTGFGAGTHRVSVWARSATAGYSGTSAYVDPGCWSTDHIVIKEYK